MGFAPALLWHVQGHSRRWKDCLTAWATDLPRQHATRIHPTTQGQAAHVNTRISQSTSSSDSTATGEDRGHSHADDVPPETNLNENSHGNDEIHDRGKDAKRACNEAQPFCGTLEPM